MYTTHLIDLSHGGSLTLYIIVMFSPLTSHQPDQIGPIQVIKNGMGSIMSRRRESTYDMDPCLVCQKQLFRNQGLYY